MKPLILAATLILSLPAAAAPDANIVAYMVGEASYARGNYDGALMFFEHVSERTRQPELLYNLALVHWRLGNVYLARTFLRAYVHRGLVPGREPWPEHVERFAKKIVAELDATGERPAWKDAGMDTVAIKGLW